jgi:ribosomal protein S27E
MNEPVKIRCPKCDSTQVYYKVRTREHQCQKCGYSGKFIDNPKE